MGFVLVLFSKFLAAATFARSRSMAFMRDPWKYLTRVCCLFSRPSNSRSGSALQVRFARRERGTKPNWLMLIGSEEEEEENGIEWSLCHRIWWRILMILFNDHLILFIIAPQNRLLWHLQHQKFCSHLVWSLLLSNLAWSDYWWFWHGLLMKYYWQNASLMHPNLWQRQHKVRLMKNHLWRKTTSTSTSSRSSCKKSFRKWDTDS